ncbi:hypothetical protein F6U93_01520 [Tamlana haliotis]|uniref:Uncharacterized protein n=1 Tax=Pseudotamlana haliotis TaxID=2614804 RepID=A0A6N6MJ20_9FLAO|nr:hypothetical protein [Tamlana haliotis]KAB1071095.1 hypothetical protein F6U93_01520 [Tamlana haliotis]
MLKNKIHGESVLREAYTLRIYCSGGNFDFRDREFFDIMEEFPQAKYERYLELNSLLEKNLGL